MSGPFSFQLLVMREKKFQEHREFKSAGRTIAAKPEGFIHRGLQRKMDPELSLVVLSLISPGIPGAQTPLAPEMDYLISKERFYA